MDNDIKIPHTSCTAVDEILAELKLEIVLEKKKTSSDHKVIESLLQQRKYLMNAIQEIIIRVINLISENEDPYIVFRNQKDWSNCVFNEIVELKELDEALSFQIKYRPGKLNKEFAQVVFLLGKIYQLLSRESSSLRREIYYENLALFNDQSQLDSIAEKISCLLGVPQWEVGLLSSSKGIVAGDLHIISGSADFDCSTSGGILIPNSFNEEAKLTSNAKFVLIIEKDSAYKKIYDEGFIEHHGPCIMMTAKGYPDVSTRVLVKSIWEQLAIPTFVLVDADPYGIEIMCIYKFGSLKQSHIGDRLAVPSIKWLGVHPTDIGDLNVPSKDISTRDLRRIHCLLLRPYIESNQELKKQMQVLSTIGKKSEIEGLLQISNGYLTDVYIPMKIESKEFI